MDEFEKHVTLYRVTERRDGATFRKKTEEIFGEVTAR